MIKPTNKMGGKTKNTLKIMVAIVCTTAVLAGIQAQAQETTPPLVKQLYKSNWPSEAEAQELIDELYYQRAIHA